MSNPVTTELEVKHLPPLDTAAITAASATWVDAQLAECADAEQRATTAARIVIAESTAADKARVERDEAACALIAHYRVRRGADIAGALGVYRTRWKAIRDAQAARHGFTRIALDKDFNMKEVGSWEALMAADDFEFPHVPDAPTVLPKLAAKAARAAARAEAARVARDQACADLLDNGWANVSIAKLIGRDPSRVSHIKHKEGRAA